MQNGHVIYKTNDLMKSVAKLRKQGFTVNLANKKNPHNAFIYFPTGAYIEILEGSHLPNFLKKLLKKTSKKSVIERIDYWDNSPVGIVGYCVEGTEEELERVVKHFQGHGQTMKMKRKDHQGQGITFNLFFPDNQELPFFMSHFSISPKPEKNHHVNTITGINSVTFPLNKEKARDIKCFIDSNESLVFDPNKNLSVTFSDPTFHLEDYLV